MPIPGDPTQVTRLSDREHVFARIDLSRPSVGDEVPFLVLGDLWADSWTHSRFGGLCQRPTFSIREKDREPIPVIARLRAAGIAVVIGGEHAQLPDVDGVLPDHVAGVEKLVDWAASQGRHHPVQFLPALPEAAWPEDRRRGYEQAMRRLGREPYPRVVFTGLLTDEPRHDHAWEVNLRYAVGTLIAVLKIVPEADVILAVTDPDVLVLAAALRELGREPQRDMLLVGYDNYLDDGVWERAFEITRPAATVDKDNLAMGAAMVDLLLRRIRGEAGPIPVRHRHRPRLVIAPA